ncbi:ABC-2 type transport system permease protein [Thermocatellispora tengchongensis]|uniref:ABC-2 type transport system permease protein n=1 Tax=Thermocatellispora tengchongensis TaxID=1073253 RepID=A0A840P984_9ACTN|nr:ABC transporter permease [Thermocatellispora tengchongensis]MBB5136228.1 ABC-2 type transport system permease protein [Thermocatellispora tengchongensis]
MTGTMTGTGTLIRLILRRDRVLLPVWIVITALLPASIASATTDLYADQAARDSFAAASASNPAQLAMRGPIYDASVGGLTAWTLGSSLALFGGLISILLMIRHTRVEEETGRRELLASGVIGRHAPLAAALAVVLAANLLHGLLSMPALVAGGLPAGSSLLFGLSTAAGGWAFAAVAAITGQLTASSGTARGIAIAIGGLLFALRSLADTGGIGWLAWLTPFGWVRLTKPYAGDQWWVLGLIAVFVTALAAAAFALSTRRDVAGGLIPARPGPAEGTLPGAFGLAARLHRGTLAGFAIGFGALGALLGVAARGLNTQLDTPQFRELAATLGGAEAGLSDVFFTFVMYVLSQLVAGAALVSALRARAEEAAGRAELLLSTPVGRLRWALSHLVFAVMSPVLLLTVLGAVAGLTFDGDVARVTGATLAYLPAVWTVAGIATLMFGLLPRLAAAVSWTALGLFLVVDLLAEFKLATGIILDLSPFMHVPAMLLGGASSPAAPLLGLTVVAITLTAAGLAFLRRRDLMPSA